MYYQNIDGFFDFEDLYDCMVSHFQDGAIFVEIGVWQGKSICYLAEKIKFLEKNIYIYGIDTWRWMGEAKLKKIVKQNNGDMFPVFMKNIKNARVDKMITPLQMLSIDAARKFLNNSIDFVFVDGGHMPECVLNDLVSWWPKVSKNGIMAGHDYKASGVKNTVKRFFKNKGKVEPCSQDSWIVQKGK